MKRLFPAFFLVFNGCFSCGTASHVQDVDPDLAVYRPAAPPLEDRHPSPSLADVAPGAWVRYQVTKNGGDASIRWGAVRKQDSSLWIEVAEEGDPKKVSLRRISFDGQVLESRYQEIPASGPPSEIVGQPLIPAADARRGFPSSEKITEETRRIGSATHPMKLVKRIFTDEALGREYEEEEGWVEGIPPLLDGLEKAGLAFRKTPAISIKVLEWGTGYTPSIK